jgi:hypothetical protein
MTSYFLPKEWITFSTLFRSDDLEIIEVKIKSNNNEAIKSIKAKRTASLKKRFIL